MPELPPRCMVITTFVDSTQGNTPFERFNSMRDATRLPYDSLIATPGCWRIDESTREHRQLILTPLDTKKSDLDVTEYLQRYHILDATAVDLLSVAATKETRQLLQQIHIAARGTKAKVQGRLRTLCVRLNAGRTTPQLYAHPQQLGWYAYYWFLGRLAHDEVL